ncbi:MAG: TetR/AcrR family transcriptional regulator [Melioribacteraceae bacterium]|nr:TetR/AcrR family transcriptional regulator [Melioribacteraceae bacterium]MCF8262930.1 TetR/AcrR family transcriptional regulator [Melioribacteraceae bacterium]MCF8431095.1 TetR/AcrR family transcriptional regulator [Melioribacteraceae bacterium]
MSSLESKIKIISGAREMFLERGFYKFTIDDLASLLKMSKKTIYKYFSSKSEILEFVVKSVTGEIRKGVEKIVESDRNPVEKLYDWSRLLATISHRVNLEGIYEMQLQYPKVWEMADEIRSKIIKRNFAKIIEDGKKEEVIKNYNTELMLSVLVGAIREVVNPKYIIENNLTIQNTIDEVVGIIIDGMLTEKGKQIFNNYKIGSGHETV